jgi:predicted permease
MEFVRSALAGFVQDARMSIRSLRSSAGFTSAVVLLLGLGIGANVAVLSVSEMLFVRPPTGISHPETLRRLYLRSDWSVGNVTEIRSQFSFPAFVALRDAYGGRVALAGFTAADTELVGADERARVAHVTADFFPVLGVRPFLGRGFTPDEDRPGAGRPVAVISDAFWKNHFGGDAHVIGRSVDIEFQRYTVVGVTRGGFSGPDLARTDIWLPMAMWPTVPGRPQQWYNNWRLGMNTRVIARVPMEARDVDQWLTSLGTMAYRRGEAANVSRGADTTATLLTGPLLESLGPSITPSAANAIVIRLLGVTAILLLIAFANVANLLIARALRRRNEIAVRIALGISRNRLVSQLITESVLLSVIAAALSLIPALWGASVLRHLLLPGVPVAGPLLDWRVLGIAIALALFGGIAAGLLPAIRALGFDVISSIKGTRGHDLPNRIAVRRVLVAAQAALSVLLLVGAGVFAKSLREVRAIDLGFAADRLVYGTLSFRDPATHVVDRYGRTHRDETGRGLPEVAARLSRRSEIEEVATAESAPMHGYSMIGLFLADGTHVPRLRDRDPAVMWVSAGYPGVTGMKMERGRFFTIEQQAAKVPVVVINETAAREYWPNRDAIGQCLHFFTTAEPCSRVIGVVKDAHLENIIEEPTVQLYVPDQRPSIIIARAAPGKTSQAAAEIAAELRRAFPSAESANVRTLESTLSPELRPWRLGAMLFSLFGMLALIIAAFGLYSVVSYSVGQRTRELGIRSALGAEPARLLSEVIADGLKAPLIGFGAGMILAAAMWPAISAMVYKARPNDPETIAAVAALLLSSAMIATIIPARRATRVDVVPALRAD